MKRLLLMVSIMVLSALLGACSSDTMASVNKPVSFDQEVDLSIYQIKEEAPPKKEPVPLNPDLSYIDTYYVEKLKEAAGEVSSTRKTYDSFPSEWDFVIIDSRPAPVFLEGHINGAINIPDSQFDTMTQMLPENKDTLLIFYCGGLACPLSSNSAEKAEALGYTNVKVYQEGAPAWKSAGNYLTVTENYVKDLILESNMTREDKAPFLLLDARPYSKYFDAHIPNAIFADDVLFTQKFLDLAPQELSTEIIVYCGGFGCHKSHVVADELMVNGYTNVKVFSGGLPLWKSKGLPVFGMSAASNSEFDVAEGKVDRGLTPEQFSEKLNGPDVAVLDVRTEQEASHGVIANSINIPDAAIHDDPSVALSQLPEDKSTTVLIHCASGARAAGVVNKIADLGYENTFYLNHAIQISADGSITYP